MTATTNVLPLPSVAHGLAVGLESLTNFKFQAHNPHTYCRICGALFQSDFDRNPEEFVSDDSNDITLSDVISYATLKRKRWSQYHAATHSSQEHDLLVKRNLWLTPDAAYRLAAYGIIPLVDMVLNDEIEDSLRQAPSIPTEDSEG